MPLCYRHNAPEKPRPPKIVPKPDKWTVEDRRIWRPRILYRSVPNSEHNPR
jgi:hypothetical protein